jgi:hypothetical protein
MSVIFKVALVHDVPRGIDKVEFTMANKYILAREREYKASRARLAHQITCKKGCFVAMSTLILFDPTAIYVDEIP